LKRGFANHPRLEGAAFLGETRTANQVFRMESFGAFPAVYKVVPAGKAHTKTGGPSYSIEGELYEVDNKILEELDRLESNGYFYRRELVKLANGKEAWMYLCLHQMAFPSHNRVKTTRNHTQVWMPNLVGNNW
jgi:gamma-glutamylcyclotransferase (GGCT)/AIG2-like uncharacterized protein YtfP